MKIQVLHESEHYVLIEAPLQADGRPPTRATILPVLEALRDQGLRMIELSLPLNDRPAMVCERIGDTFAEAQRENG